jgi:hypothetical protein
MFLATTQPKESIGGPLWFIQLWAYAYFPQLAPKPNPSIIGKCACYGHLVAQSVYETNNIPDFGDWFNLFSDKERVRSPPCFLPFAESKFSCPEMFLLNQGVSQLPSSLWAYILQTRDLIVLQNKFSGFEVYITLVIWQDNLVYFNLYHCLLFSLPMCHGIEEVLLPMRKLKS